MARQARLSLPGVLHYLVQRGHNGSAIAADAQDSERLLAMLRDAALNHGVVLHAYALLPQELRVLATPESADGISRMMQTLGRRYATVFNHRHGRSGALWDGRFRSALVEGPDATLLALRHVDAAVPWAGGSAPLPGQPATLPASPAAGELQRGSGAHRSGGRRDPALVDPPVYWQLGNTPFEREQRYRHLLEDALTAAERQRVQQALTAGWALGSPSFLADLAARTARPLQPRPRGRPRRQP